MVDWKVDHTFKTEFVEVRGGLYVPFILHQCDRGGSRGGHLGGWGTNPNPQIKMNFKPPTLHRPLNSKVDIRNLKDIDEFKKSVREFL